MTAGLRLPILFGIPGAVVVAIVGVKLFRQAIHRAALSFWERALLVAGPVLVVRFVILPDKLEYVLPLLVLVLLAFAHRRMSRLWLATLSLSSASLSVITLSLFVRDAEGDHLRFSLHLDHGAVAQDWDASRYEAMARDTTFLDAVATIVYRNESGPRPKLRAENFANGLISDSNDLIVGRSELYRMDNPRFPGEKFRRAAYRWIFICDKSMSSPIGGWRSLQPPPDLPAIDPQTGRLDLICEPENPSKSAAP